MYCCNIIVRFKASEEDVYDVLEIWTPQVCTGVAYTKLKEEILEEYRRIVETPCSRLDAAEEAYNNIICKKYGGEWNYLFTGFDCLEFD